ncbi:MAG: PD40 domain-containing protein [Deltaproteobacteria bacterium]|nr:PD40 domain-containing protein [Deltaproteobacteria bacterium]
MISIFLSSNETLAKSPWLSIGNKWSFNNSLNPYYKNPGRFFTTAGFWGKNSGYFGDILTGKSGIIPWPLKKISSWPEKITNNSSFYSVILISYSPLQKKAWYYIVLRKKGRPRFLTIVDYEKNKVIKMLSVKENAALPLGISPDGKYFVYSSNNRDSFRNSFSGTMFLHRMIISSGKVDRKIRVQFPKREKLPSSYSIVWAGDATFNTFYGREHDEFNPKTAEGFLVGPKTQGIIVNLDKSSVFRFDSPVEVWSSVFSTDGKFLFISSYRKKVITRLNIQLKKQDISRYTGTYNILLAYSSTGLLYAFTRMGKCVVFDKRIKKKVDISRSTILKKKEKPAGPYIFVPAMNSVLYGYRKPSVSNLPSYSIKQLKLK